MAYNIADLFEHTVDSVADREVLVVGDERRTYGQLEARANQLGHHLLAQGIQPGDHIGIYGSNSIEWIESAIAACLTQTVEAKLWTDYVNNPSRGKIASRLVPQLRQLQRRARAVLRKWIYRHLWLHH